MKVEHKLNHVTKMASAGNPANTGTSSHIPGEAGIWLFIIVDLIVFAVMFYVYVYCRSINAELYRVSQQALNTTYGTTYTVLLLTSSWLVVAAVRAARSGFPETSAKLIGAAFLCGVAFLILKIVEYCVKIAAGITPMTNEFFAFFFIYTGLHLIHVSIGLCVLGFMKRKARARPSLAAGGKDLLLIEVGASYWHMVDLIWVVLFALLYLKG